MPTSYHVTFGKRHGASHTARFWDRDESNALRACWIAAAAEITAFSLKGLRNIFASLLANAGVHEQVTGVPMGHARRP
jgi:hypothetical protein